MKMSRIGGIRDYSFDSRISNLRIVYIIIVVLFLYHILYGITISRIKQLNDISSFFSKFFKKDEVKIRNMCIPIYLV